LKSPPPESLDTLAVTLEFANRVSGVLCGVRATPLFWRVHVFGNQGSAEAVGPNELIVRLSGGKVERRTFEAVNALRANLEAFADAIEGHSAYPIPTAQMVDTIAGIEAIAASVESGREVTLPS
jgi:predicted dehydrogenase